MRKGDRECQPDRQLVFSVDVWAGNHQKDYGLKIMGNLPWDRLAKELQIACKLGAMTTGQGSQVRRNQTQVSILRD